MGTSYVTQGGLLSGTSYFIDTITADGTWQAVVVPGDCRAVALKGRTGNVDSVYTYLDTPPCFNFAKTATPGNNWVPVYGIEIPITKSATATVGYVKSAIGTYITVVGVN